MPPIVDLPHPVAQVTDIAAKRPTAPAGSTPATREARELTMDEILVLTAAQRYAYMTRDLDELLGSIQ